LTVVPISGGDQPSKRTDQVSLSFGREGSLVCLIGEVYWLL